MQGTPDDWYKLSTRILKNNCGDGIYAYMGSVINLVREHLPNNIWYEWRFNYVSNNFWKNKLNRRQYIIWLGGVLGYKNISDWYRTTRKDFYDNYGGGLIQCQSLYSLLSEIFPDYTWYEWKFVQVSHNFWKNKDNCVRYMEWLFHEMNYSHIDDWYSIRICDIINNFGGGFFDAYQTLANIFANVCPNHKWDNSKFAKAISKAQLQIYQIVKRIWPDVQYNFRHPMLKFEQSGYSMEIDIWIPEINVGIEYQGMQHFQPIKFYGGEHSFKLQQKRDVEKRKKCLENNIFLLEIDHNWDGDGEKLLKKIYSLSQSNLT